MLPLRVGQIELPYVEILCLTKKRQRILGDQPLQGILIFPNNNNDDEIKYEFP